MLLPSIQGPPETTSVDWPRFAWLRCDATRGVGIASLESLIYRLHLPIIQI